MALPAVTDLQEECRFDSAEKMRRAGDIILQIKYQ
jgi:hypothetical protein